MPSRKSPDPKRVAGAGAASAGGGRSRGAKAGGEGSSGVKVGSGGRGGVNTAADALKRRRLAAASTAAVVAEPRAAEITPEPPEKPAGAIAQPAKSATGRRPETPSPDPASGPPAPMRRPRARGEAAREAKRAAILGAALEVFAEKGYAETRLEDVARKAGVAKGTIYLYVPSKEALFEQLVRAGLGSRLALAEERVAGLDISAEDALRLLFTTLRTEVLETRRHAIARIVLAEAGRFPGLADFYYREVVTRGMAVIRGIAERGMATGEFASDALVRFPQLAIAPALVALVWTSLFQRTAPLDAEAMLETHLQILMRGLKGEPS